MNTWLILASFFFIFCKSFQQLSVAYKKYWWVPPMSYAMAGLEIFIIVGVVKAPTIATWLLLGTGAFLGCWVSMWLHPLVTGKGWGSKHKRRGHE